MPSVRDVTIVIPAFCVDKRSLTWLEECLSSACSQGCDVIVADDGSPIDIAPVVSK